MKPVAYAPIFTLLLSFSCASFAADSPDRPAGVAAANWVPVSGRVGIVLVPSETPARALPSDKPLLLKPPVNGYFMVKGAGGWTRLIVIEPVKGPADVG